VYTDKAELHLRSLITWLTRELPTAVEMTQQTLTKFGLVDWTISSDTDAAATRIASVRTPDALRAAALWELSILEWRQTDHDRAGAHLEDALTLYRRLGDTSGVGRVLSSLGRVFHSDGDSRLRGGSNGRRCGS